MRIKLAKDNAKYRCGEEGEIRRRKFFTFSLLLCLQTRENRKLNAKRFFNVYVQANAEREIQY